MNTIGGGIVLDPFLDHYYLDKNNSINSIPLNPKERFLFLVDSSWEKPKTSKEWKKIFIKYHDKIDNWFEQLGLQKSESDKIFSLGSIERGKARMKTFFKNFHSKNFLRKGVPIETIVSSLYWPQDFIKIILNLLIAEKHIKKAMEFIV